MVNWLDLAIIVCLAVGLIKGIVDGFVKQVVSFLALAVAIFFAGQIAVPIRSFLFSSSTVTAIPQPVISGLCYLLAFALIIIAIVWVGKLVSFAIKMTPAKPLNTLLGGLFGMFIWIFSLSLLFNIVAVFDYHSKIIPAQIQKESFFYNRIKSVVPTLYPVLKDYFKS
jgi:membrane protein required for colicin V production